MPEQVLRLFHASEVMMGIGISAVRIFGLVWLVCIPNLVTAASLQGISQGTASMKLTMLRQAVLPVLFAFILSRSGNLTAVWLSFMLAECLCIPYGWHLWKRLSTALLHEEIPI